MRHVCGATAKPVVLSLSGHESDKTHTMAVQDEAIRDLLLLGEREGTLSHALVEKTHTEQSVSTDMLVETARMQQAESARTFGILAIIFTWLAVALAVVGGATHSNVLSLGAVAPLVAAIAMFLLWNAGELSRI